MSWSSSRRFPATITRLPFHRRQICYCTAPHRPGGLSEALNGHYRRTHPQALGLPDR
jgi:hypothetical protein